MDAENAERLLFPAFLPREYPYAPIDDSDMDSDVVSEDGHSCASLADSTYEIVSNHPDQTSDPAEESDFTAPDDTRSNDGSSDFSEPDTPHTQNTPQQSTDGEQAIEDESVIHESADSSQAEDVEASAMTSGTIVSAVMSTGGDAATSYSFPSSPAVPISQVECPRAAQSLRLDRPLRIIYHGPESYRVEILDKIAQAVATSLDAGLAKDSQQDGYEHFQVISLPSSASSVHSPQNTPKPGAPPDVTLIPSSGVEVAVQICDLCSDPSMERRKASCRDRTSISGVCAESHDLDGLDDSNKSAMRKTACHQIGFCNLHRLYEREKYDGKVKPDLAVFFHSTSQLDPGLKVCASSCSHICSAATSRIGIPVLDIAEDVRFSAIDTPRFVPSRGLAPHLLEQQIGEAGSVARPLDLQAFFALDTTSLNRNIALLTGLHDGQFDMSMPSFVEIKAWTRKCIHPSNMQYVVRHPTFLLVGLMLAVAMILSQLQTNKGLRAVEVVPDLSSTNATLAVATTYTRTGVASSVKPSTSSSATRKVTSSIRNVTSLYSAEAWRMDTLASSLFGADGMRWVSLANAELDSVLVAVQATLHTLLLHIQKTWTTLHNQYVRASRAATKLAVEQNPFKDLEHAVKVWPKNAACVRRRLRHKPNHSIMLANVHCESQRLSKEASKAWEQGVRKAKVLSQVSRDTSQALFQNYKKTATAFRDTNLQKIKERTAKLTNKARRRAHQVRARGSNAKKDKSKCRSVKHGRCNGH
ncbi:hypothetical protein FH972_024543 [Carpinus fangiana]|uniref:Uncharacterized protein n=1 Tax=Carpinus fangiana TaxID=176857 RepID=A0A5N6KYA5_9ROSI|nr:hypothetical protein FH972_024543 [Carpinus fangiana]